LNELINAEIFRLNKNKTLHEKVDNCLKDIDFAYKINKRFSITSVLRMLQLLTENHNEKLQASFSYNLYF
jgi:hypothetical protein